MSSSRGFFLTQGSNPYLLCLLHWQAGFFTTSATEEAHKSMCARVLSPTLCDPMTEPARLFYAKDSPAKNMGVGCHDLLQGIFPTQRLSLNLHHWQADCLPLNHLGSKLVVELQANCSASPRVPFQGFCVQNPSLQSQESVRFSGVFLQPINIAPMLAFIITLLLCSIPYATAEDSSLIPGSGRSPGEGSGKPLQYSCLGNPTDRGAWRATVYGVAKSRTRQSAQQVHTRYILIRELT